MIKSLDARLFNVLVTYCVQESNANTDVIAMLSTEGLPILSNPLPDSELSKTNLSSETRKNMAIAIIPGCIFTKSNQTIILSLTCV